MIDFWPQIAPSGTYELSQWHALSVKFCEREPSLTISGSMHDGLLSTEPSKLPTHMQPLVSTTFFFISIPFLLLSSCFSSGHDGAANAPLLIRHAIMGRAWIDSCISLRLKRFKYET
eukprot:1147834-Pelagomonas_calceolata.AAC.5